MFHRLPRIAVGVLFSVSLLSGCAGYQVGASTLFHPGVRTVHVPVFVSASYRRNLGERLTEAVVKELELRGLKAVGPDTADSRLSGNILSAEKRVIGLDANSVPRSLEVGFLVEVQWTDRVGNELLNQSFHMAENLIPESGQSMATSQQAAIDQTARQIVSRMEMRW